MYKWCHPVHEVLISLDKEKEIVCEDIILNHHPDYNKSRSSYLPLLELSVKEDPNDDRNMFYLGREYMYYEKWEKCISTLKKHLQLQTATWKDERAASMRFIARSYYKLNDSESAIEWYLKAIDEAPNLRESYVELAYLYYENNNNEKAYIFLKKALEIKEKSKTYINEEFAWNSFIYDLLSIVAYNLKLFKEAYDNALIAYSTDKDERIKNNLMIMKESIG